MSPTLVRRLAKPALLVAALVASSLIGEVSLAMLSAKWTQEKLVESSCERAGLPYDGRTKRQVVEDLRKQGIEAFPSIRNRDFRTSTRRIRVAGKDVIPLTGVSNARTILCNESGKPGEYLSDEHGFNNPKGLYVPGNVELALVGDSFVQGYCVGCEETISARLRPAFPTALNLGTGGNGPLSALAAIAEYCEPLKAKNVVWFYFELNDLEDDLREERESPLIEYLKPKFSNRLIECQVEIDTQLREYVKEALSVPPAPPSPRRVGNPIWNALLLRETRTVLRNAFPRNDYSKPHELLPLFEKTIAAAKLRVEAFGGKLYFVYLPCWKRFREPGYQFATKARIEEILKANDIPYLDMVTEFESTGKPKSLFPFELDGHYSAAGYRLVAECVTRTFGESIRGRRRD